MTSDSKGTVFFIDRCLGKHPITEELRGTGVQVEVHDDHFPSGATDAQWIPQVGKMGWIVLTKDKRITYNALERQAVARAGIRMFTLASTGLSGEDTAFAFKKALNPMLKFLGKNPAPFIAKVYKDGNIKKWKDANDLLSEI